MTDMTDDGWRMTDDWWWREAQIFLAPPIYLSSINQSGEWESCCIPLPPLAKVEGLALHQVERALYRQAWSQFSTQKDFEPNFYHADRSWQAETCKLASSRKLQRASSQGTWLTWMPMKWVRQHDLGTPNQMKPHYPFPIIIMQCSVWKEGERLYYYP